MSDQQNPLERAVDLFVFAPVGVAMFAKDTVPTFLKMFVSRGQTEIARQKKSLHDQANQYRMVGKFAVKYGGPVVKQQAEGKLDGARRIAEETISGLVPSMGGGADDAKPAPAPKAPAKPPRAEETPKRAAATGAATNGASKGPGANGKSSKPSAPASAVATPPALAIPDYDQLSASQVVQRLDGLTPEELDAVRQHEVAHRGRNTILGKITQLAT